MNKTTINTLLFDFGRVLLPLNIDATYKAFRTLGAKPSLTKDADLFKDWERGTLSPKEFVESLRKELKYATHEKSIWEAWQAMILEMPDEHLNLLKKLKKRYSLLLVSNINEVHEAHIKNTFGIFKYKQFLKQFDGIYYSHQMGKRKPEPAFFKQVIKEQALKPETCLFIDDTLENIHAAEKLGFKTWHYDPEIASLENLEKRVGQLIG